LKEELNEAERAYYNQLRTKIRSEWARRQAAKKLVAQDIQRAIARDRTASENDHDERTDHDSKQVRQREKEVRICPVVKDQEDHSRTYFNGPVEILFIHYRRRAVDTDSTVIKYALDGLVSAGVLPDDKPKWIPERPQEVFIKIPPKEEERTVIVIWTMEQ
jgi:hypothetical protein